MPSSDSSRDALLERLAEEFVERHRRGERPALSEYTDHHPDLAAEIRDLFPAMAQIENLKPEAGDLSGALVPASSPKDQHIPERFGEYRILRQVGQGGMGVVYEAEQESLGRHVALKVLPRQALLKATYLERFRREAKAAGRLHHTNIVPVFGVGEWDGTHFYAMQFIAGEGLDKVLRDLRRLRAVPGGQSIAADPAEASVAHGLMTGSFVVAPAPFAEVPAAGPAPSSPTSADMVHGSSTLSVGGSESQYFRGIARIALQIADALAYAHRQGILHRDIKPSNLLLDQQGTVWITDFGLAKAEGADDLTQTGDIVGTIRYMAPERFEGRSLPQSDVYAWGVTLYELLTLRPAFDHANKARLVDKVLHEPPVSPRKIDPLIPRDLETVVLKCLAKEPAERYASAEELAEDVRRFLADRPIRARRSTWRERTWRWCRRNPAVAGSLAAVLLSLMLGTIVSLVFGLQARHDRDRAQDSEREGRRKLFEAYVAEAKANVLSRRPGQRFASLDALREAVKIAHERNMPAERLDELRNLAVACLALLDWRVLREYELPPGTGGLDWDERGERYAYAHIDGHVTVRRLQDGGEIGQLTFMPGAPGFSWVSFSPGGRFLLAEHLRGRRIWDLGRAGWPVVPGQFPEVTWHPDGRHAAILGSGNSLYQVDLAAPEQPYRLMAKLDAPAHSLHFNSTGTRLAMVRNGAVYILDAETGAMQRIPEPRSVAALAWHPRGKFLALVCKPYTIHIWDVTREQRVAVLEGCRASGIRVAFTSDGEFLVSSGWEGKVRFWSWRTGQQVLGHPGDCNLHSSLDGRMLIVDAGRLKLVQLGGGAEYRSMIWQSNAAALDLEYRDATVDATGRMLAVAMSDGVRFWDLHDGDEAAHIPTPPRVNAAVFTADGLLTVGGYNGHSQGMLFWPIHRAVANAVQWRVGPPQYLQTADGEEIGANKDGRVIVVPSNRNALVLRLDCPERTIQLRAQQDVRWVGVSPDGALAATGVHNVLRTTDGIKLWETQTGRFIKEVPVGTIARAVFSPNAKWLAVRGNDRAHILSVGTWQEIATGRWDPAQAFSPDSRLLAVESGGGAIRLLDPATGRDKARLEDPNQDRVGPLRFTPDGTCLLAVCNERKAIHIWNLRLIRQALAALDLDWEDTPYPPAPPPEKDKGLQITVVGADLVGDPRKMLAQELDSYALRLSVNPFDVDAHFQSGRVLLTMGDSGRALVALNSALAFQTNHPRALFLRGRLYQQQGRWQEAIDDFTRILDQQPDDHEVRRMRGECRCFLGDAAGRR